MADTLKKSGDELLIVDNSDTDWKVLNYLREWADISTAFDVATGTFEIGSLLALDGQWQKLEKLRILLGDEVSKRTRQVLLDGVAKGLDASLEKEKESNDFLTGVPGILEAMRNRKIECRVYNKAKFHAKAYITHAKQLVVGSAALVGSSNFTKPGLTDNVELNIQLRREVPLLHDWYEEHWNKAEDVTEELLKTIERHTREYTPFEVYAKALQEFFRGHEMTTSEWELAGPEHGGSRMYKVLDQYQKEGYHALLKIGSQFGGAFLCDGVGLGKTYVGLMIIERLIMHDRKRVALIVPKAARKDVWERDLRRYLGYLCGDFSNLVIFNHTDLLRGGDFQCRLDRVKEMADVILIDEAHHFRNPGVKGSEGEFLSRYWRLFDICEGKSVFMLTATPVNNRLIDLQHMIELFSRRCQDYFKDAPLGIQSIQGHFRRLENELEKLLADKEAGGSSADFQTNQAEAEQVLLDDELFRKIVVQRSRAYVKQSQEQHGGTKAIFPKREDPRVVNYQLRKTYGRLLDLVEEAFQKDKPLFSLAVYYPLAYYIGPDMEKQQRSFMENRQKAVVSLIRTLFLKRFESSAKAFEFSCGALLIKLLTWVTKHSKNPAAVRRLDRWKRQHDELIQYVFEGHRELMGDVSDREAEEDIIDEEMLEGIEELSPDEYKVDEILDETLLDLDQILEFLRELKKFKPANDDKLKALIKLLRQDETLVDQKVLIFSEFMATTRYLRKQLEEAGFTDVDEVDSASGRDRSEIIRAFAPYYNQPPEEGLFDGIEKEIKILVSTDVLSEGLNLQDATRLVNYDLHWNPVRLMQRIGRVDRRLNPEIEEQIIKGHPELKDIRGTVIYWNFLPPGELDKLLRLYKVVSHKTLRISKVFGIEGRKLLHPKDNYETLKDFNHDYEGTTTAEEAMHLEYQKLLADNPGLGERLAGFPFRIFSGKKHPSPGTQAVFFCYALPAQAAKDREVGSKDLDKWTEEAGFRKWYMYVLTNGKIAEEPSEIINLIRSTPETPRYQQVDKKTLSEIRAQIDRHIKNTYLKQVQAPIGVKPVLKAWMELA
jgi:superfamily II DNA or RNA helicase